MAVAATPILLNTYSQGALLKYVQNAIAFMSTNNNMRDSLLLRDRVYQREMDWTKENLRARAENRQGQANKIANVTMPVVMPQVEAAHGYLVDTFLSSTPVFPVNSVPQYEDIAKQIDAIMDESATRFQYVRQLSMTMRDGLKYNLMACEVEWKNLKVFSVSSNPQKDLVFGTPVETEFSGNILKRIDLYNIIIDDRVLPCEVHEKGDFIGYTELLSRIQLKQLFLELDNTLTMNADAAFQSTSGVIGVTGSVSTAYYVPQINPDALRDPTFTTMNWLSWAQIDTKQKIEHADMYEVSTMYVRVIPREYGINAGKNLGINGVPQIFKLITVNQQVIIYCERKSNAHNYLPIVVGQPIEDGLRYQTKSFADNATPYQNISSALWNSGMASQRRKVYDRIFYDPSKINKADIDKADPVARIPVKTEAYGKPISDAIYVAPYRDDGVPNILQMAQQVTEMADISTGQNRVQRGQFQKGNKTLHEFDTVMDKSDLRPRTMAVVMESSFFQPIKYILKMNILQYQPPATLFNAQTQQNVTVDPSDLRKVAWQFKVADGVLPVSQQFNTEELQQLMQLAAGAPQLFAGYDLGGMIIYNMKLGGATWVDAFKLTQPQAQQQAQATAGPQPNGPQQTTPAVAPASAGSQQAPATPAA